MNNETVQTRKEQAFRKLNILLVTMNKELSGRTGFKHKIIYLTLASSIDKAEGFIIARYMNYQNFNR